MLIVWGRKNASNVKKVLWCLEELQISYETKDVGGPFGGLDTVEYQQMNPNKTIPTLQDDRFTLWESNSILRYLTAKYDPSHLLTSTDVEEMSTADQWMDWAGINLFPLIKDMMNKIVRRPEEQRIPEQTAEIYQNLAKLMLIANSAIATQAYFGGQKFGIADIAIAPLFYQWRELAPNTVDLVHLERWFGQLKTRPAFQKIVLLPVS